jgi:hypothetical protein
MNKILCICKVSCQLVADLIERFVTESTWLFVNFSDLLLNCVMAS